MKEFVCTCDRCGNKIKGNSVVISAVTMDYKNKKYLGDLYPELREMDFCKNCADFFADLIRQHCKKGAPAIIDPDTEAAVDEMIATSQSKDTKTDPPPSGGQAEATIGFREDRGPEKSRLDGKGDRRGNELLRSSGLQRVKEAGNAGRQKESSGA